MADIWKLLATPVKTPTETLVAGTVDFYNPGTTGESNRKDVYTDAAGTIVAANPYTLDSDATAVLYGSGLYHVVIKDSSGNTEYDYDFITPDKEVYAFTPATLAELQAITGYPGATANLLARTTLGDGGGGQFYWNSADLSTEVAADEVNTGEGDGGYFVAPGSDKTGASGAWVDPNPSGVANILKYGADKTGVASSSAAVQLAMTNFETVWGPAGTYDLQSTVVQTRKNIVLGAGKSTIFTSSTNDLFSVGGTNFDQSEFRNAQFISTAGGGNIFTQQGLVKNYRFEDSFFDQQNDAKSIYSHIADQGNYIGNVWENNVYYHTYTATVPAFYFKVLTSAGAANGNRWEGGEIVRGSKPWFYIESNRAGNYVYDTTIKDIIAEVTTQGIVAAYGVNGFIIDNVKPFDIANQSPTYDLNTALFYFNRGTNASNQPSRNIVIKNYLRTDADANLNGNVDFQFESSSGASAVGVSFHDCGRTISTDILADLTNAQKVSLYDSNITISGTGYTDVSEYSGEGIVVEQLNLKKTYFTIEELTFAGTVNNHAIADTTTLLRCALGGSARVLTGIVAPADASTSSTRYIYIFNSDASLNLTINHDTSSASANRFYCPGATHYVVAPYSGVTAYYDATLTRWVLLTSPI